MGRCKFGARCKDDHDRTLAVWARSLHEHPLAPEDGAAKRKRNFCDECGKKVKGGQSYRCATGCDWDLCAKCFGGCADVEPFVPEELQQGEQPQPPPPPPPPPPPLLPKMKGKPMTAAERNRAKLDAWRTAKEEAWCTHISNVLSYNMPILCKHPTLVHLRAFLHEKCAAARCKASSKGAALPPPPPPTAHELAAADMGRIGQLRLRGAEQERQAEAAAVTEAYKAARAEGLSHAAGIKAARSSWTAFNDHLPAVLMRQRKKAAAKSVVSDAMPAAGRAAWVLEAAREEAEGGADDAVALGTQLGACCAVAEPKHHAHGPGAAWDTAPGDILLHVASFFAGGTPAGPHLGSTRARKANRAKALRHASEVCSRWHGRLGLQAAVSHCSVGDGGGGGGGGGGSSKKPSALLRGWLSLLPDTLTWISLSRAPAGLLARLPSWALAHVEMDGTGVSAAERALYCGAVARFGHALDMALLWAIAERCPETRILHLTGRIGPFVLAQLGRFRELRVVNLASVSTAEHIAEPLFFADGFRSAVSGWSQLRQIRLGAIRWQRDPDSVLSLLGASCPLLEFVTTTCFEVGDSGVIDLARGCKRLRHLHAPDSSVTSASVCALVRECRYLEELCMDRCNLGDETLRGLRAVWEEAHTARVGGGDGHAAAPLPVERLRVFSARDSDMGAEAVAAFNAWGKPRDIQRILLRAVGPEASSSEEEEEEEGDQGGPVRRMTAADIANGVSIVGTSKEQQEQKTWEEAAAGVLY